MRKLVFLVSLSIAMMFGMTMTVAANQPTKVNVSTWAQLQNALKNATSNSDQAVDIHITGKVSVPNKTAAFKIPENVFLYVNSGATFSINQANGIQNYGTIIIEGTINHSGNITNYNAGKVFKGPNAKIQGSSKIISNGSPIDRNTNWLVTFNANGGKINGQSRIVVGVPKSNPRLPSQSEPVKSGFRFVGWFESNGTEWKAGNTVTRDLTLLARWAANNVTINYFAGEGGSVSRTSETVSMTAAAKGSKATAASGYTFVNWINSAGTVVSTSANFIPPKVNGVNVAATYRANFQQNNQQSDNITINYFAGEGGTVSRTGETLSPTATAQGSRATAASGYTFVNWINSAGTVVSTSANFIPPKVNGVNVAATYRANFRQNK